VLESGSATGRSCRLAWKDDFVLNASPILIVGTAATARAALDQMMALPSNHKIVAGIVLVDPGDTGLGARPPVPILGGIDDIPDICDQLGIKAALVSLPGVMTEAMARIRAVLRRCGVAERFLPTISDVLTDTASRQMLVGSKLDMAALIGREPRSLDESGVRALLTGKRVLITGAGGSIGSELARRCASMGPATLIMMERAENALFEIDRQIAAQFPGVERRAVLHDVVDADATLRRLVAIRPDVVFHAAAHKHVPMMEDHPAAAVNNNLFGTKSIADASVAVGVERFVMVSTDKAVNPTSVMGATKRLAELYVRSLNHSRPAPAGQGSRFRLVRFGNVLGSACSVLPIWSNQLAEGGPVTVTHPAMTRYFMSIPEAAALVIQAGAIQGSAADVFVLDMGEPVRIRDLAARFIRSHGLEPKWEDPQGLMDGRGETEVVPDGVPSVRVLFTGARPGEKLHEELAYSKEELQSTPIPGILAWSGEVPDPAAITRMIADMSSVRHAEAQDVVLSALRANVPEMMPTATSRADAA